MTSTRPTPDRASAFPIAPVVTFQYGDLVVRYESPDGATPLAIFPEFEEFRVSDDTPPSCTVSWTFGAIDLPTREPDVAGIVWDWWKEPDGSDLSIFYWLDQRVPYMALRFAPDMRRATIVQDAGQIGGIAHVGLHPMNELVACRLLPSLGAVNLHASTAVLDGRSALFMGHSGAGKTTIAELAHSLGAPILSDDRTIIGMRDGTPWSWGTPWHGSGRFTSSRSAPVGGIFLLVQAPEERLVPIAPARAWKEMFIRLIHQKLSETEVTDAFAVLDRLSASVPMWELHFRPVPEAIDTVRAALGGGAGRTGA